MDAGGQKTTMISCDSELQKLRRRAQGWNPPEKYGYVQRVVGMTLQARGPAARVGQQCRLIPDAETAEEVMAEVVGFDANHVILLPLSEVHGIKAGIRIHFIPGTFTVAVGPQLQGRILDGLGRIMDDKPQPDNLQQYSIYRSPPDPLARQRVVEPLEVGVRAIDGLLTCGRGQRLGIFAGSGVGKSTLLGMIARNSSAYVNVIGLIGERGREVRDFIEDDLGAQGLKNSVVIAATSDQPPLVRIKSAHVATTVAEYFRDQGKDVMLIMDSLTRFAMAQREVGLAAGEPPATRGYPPSVFSMLPQLLERSGNSDAGTMTAFYSVLVEGDDMDEPITDAVRGILDGHIHLSRDLADENHYPAIDILGSVSRLMPDVVSDQHREAAVEFKRLLAAYEEARDLINIGAYQEGSDPKVDRALQLLAEMDGFLQQDVTEQSTLPEAKQQLIKLLSQ